MPKFVQGIYKQKSFLLKISFIQYSNMRKRPTSDKNPIVRNQCGDDIGFVRKYDP